MLGTHDFFHHKFSPKSQIKRFKKAVILKAFNRQEKKKGKITRFVYLVLLCSQKKYRRMIKICTLFLANIHIWLNLPLLVWLPLFLYIFPWMIATLDTNKNSSKKLKKHYLESTFNLKYRMKYFTYSPFTTYLKIFTCPQLWSEGKTPQVHIRSGKAKSWGKNSEI